MKYKVTITETLQQTVEIEADSRAEAEEKAEDLWNQEEYALDSDDFQRVSFEAEEAVERIRVLVIRPGKRPRVEEIGTELADMQAVVGEGIGMCCPFNDEAAVVCNDQGKVDGLPLNRAIYSLEGELADIVAGTFFICNAPVSSDTFHSLSDEQIKKYESMFHDPERFRQTENGILVQKIRPDRGQER